MVDRLRVPLQLPDWRELNRRCAQSSTGLEGSLLQQEANLTTWLWAKGASLLIRGDLTIIDSYNVASVAKGGTGLYDITLDQTSIDGLSVHDLIIPVTNVYAPFAAEFATATFDGDISPGVIRVHVREFYIAGQNLRIQDYDLGPTEELWFGGLLNWVDPNAENLPT